MGSFRIVGAGLAVVVLWASAFPAIQVASPELGVFGLALARLAIASISLLIIAPFAKVRLPDLRDVPLILLCAFFGMAAYQVLLNWGELGVPAGTASLIVAAAPLVSVGLAAVLFAERLTVVKIVGSAVAIGGVALVTVSRSGFSAGASVWILVGATIVQGVYHPLTKPLLRKYSGLELATYVMIAGLLMLLPTLPWAWPNLVTASPSAWWSAVYLGLLPSAAGFVIWGYAVARLPIATATALLYLVPAVAVAIAFVWLGEIPIPAELAGGAVVVLGVALIGLGDRMRARLPRAKAPAIHMRG